jgi:phosphoribosyl-AMP cyclohydrolase
MPAVDIEEGFELKLDFDKIGDIGRAIPQIVPVVIQDDDSRDVLFVGYANREALETTLRERIAVLWSTSRDELWRKGETSGDTLSLVDVRVNCEQNALLYLVRRTTDGACHTRGPTGSTRPTCFYRSVLDPSSLQPASG